MSSTRTLGVLNVICVSGDELGHLGFLDVSVSAGRVPFDAAWVPHFEVQTFGRVGVWGWCCVDGYGHR